MVISTQAQKAEVNRTAEKAFALCKKSIGQKWHPQTRERLLSDYLDRKQFPLSTTFRNKLLVEYLNILDILQSLKHNAVMSLGLEEKEKI